MKNFYRIAASVLAVTLLTAAHATAQNEMLVEWIDSSTGAPAINSLVDAIRGDTLSNGERANPDRIYKLRQGGYYFITETIENDGYHLRIEGEPSGTTLLEAPPVIQMFHREDGSNAGRLLNASGDVTLSNLILNGETNLSARPYEMIRFNGSGATITLDNVVLEHAEWGIMAVYGAGSNIHVRNSKFRNLLSHTQPWGGRGISIWTDVNEVVFENNSFFNIGAFAVQVEGGAANKFVFDHNTIVNNGRQVILGSWWRQAYITNNLIVNGFWHGEDENDFTANRLARDDRQYAGMFGIQSIPSQYGLDLERSIVVANNATWRDPAFDAYYATSAGSSFPYRAQPFLNQETEDFIEAYSGMVASDNLDNAVDPGLSTYNSDQTNAMIQNISDLRSGAATVGLYYWNPGRFEDPVSVIWPLPEDLSYSNSSLQSHGIGGYPLGDLNWYPSQKASWEGEKDDLAAQIEAMAGGTLSVDFISKIEAETGMASNGASIDASADQFFIDLKGAGSITWTVDVAAAGTYDMGFQIRSPFGQKKQRLYVNGTEVPGADGGEALDYSEATWGEVLVSGVELAAGTNTVAVTPSWGYQEFGDATVYAAGSSTVVTTLPTVEATLDSMSLVCWDTNDDGNTACASGGRFITLGTGTATIPVDAPASGYYALKFFYSGSGTTDIAIDGSTAASGFAFLPDGASADLINVFLHAGANSVTLTGVGGNVIVDYVELFRLSGGVNTETSQLPEGYALDQNYPNPFNPTTAIEFTLGGTSNVSLVVYDVLGRRIATLVDAQLPAGAHRAIWEGLLSDGTVASSGVYLYRLQTDVGQQTRSMVLMK